MLAYPPSRNGSLSPHPPQGAQAEGGNVMSWGAHLYDLIVSSPLTTGHSLTTDLDALVDLASRLSSSLPTNCQRLGQHDLKVVGTHPIDAGGFADVWPGEMGGRKVAVKSYRCYLSTDSASTHIEVSHTSPDVCYAHQQPINRDFTMKRWYTLVSLARTWYHSSGFIPLESTHSLSSLNSWTTSTSGSTSGTTTILGSSTWYVFIVTQTLRHRLSILSASVIGDCACRKAYA